MVTVQWFPAVVKCPKCRRQHMVPNPRLLRCACGNETMIRPRTS